MACRCRLRNDVSWVTSCLAACLLLVPLGADAEPDIVHRILNCISLSVLTLLVLVYPLRFTMGSFSKFACLLAVAAAGAAQGLVDQSTAAPATSIEPISPTELPTSVLEPIGISSSASSSTGTSITPTATSTPAPHTPSANITSISFSGNGCPQGTHMQVTGDLISGLQFTVPNFTVASRSDFDPRKRTANCQAHLNIGVGEKGWQISPDLIGYRGFSVLDSSGTRVDFYVTSYWSHDAAVTESTKTTISNPDGRRLAKFVDTAVRHELWSACAGKNGGSVGLLNINFRASVVSTDTAALAYFGPLEVLGRPEAEVSQTITYKLRQCQS
ncbi:hypothetical protein RB597_007783 [Gaeumannomyces tritici]